MGEDGALVGAFGFPVDAVGVAPEVVEVVEHTGVLVEDVDDDVDHVAEEPGLPLVAAAGDGGVAAGGAELLEVFHDGAHLPGAGAGGDDVVVGDGGEATDVEDDDVVATGVGRQSGGVDRELPGRLGPVGDLGYGCRARDGYLRLS